MPIPQWSQPNLGDGAKSDRLTVTSDRDLMESVPAAKGGDSWEVRRHE